MIIKRRFLTLMEIMVVILLIMMITGVIAYNYSGSLEEGKVYKTKLGIEKVQNVLNLAVAKDPDLLDNISTDWKQVIAKSSLVQNPDALARDGWGNFYQVEVEDGRIIVYSKRLDDYEKTHKK